MAKTEKVNLDLNLLVALDALLAESNVTRAADRLFIGQPAMSATLNKLRKHYGDELLVREGRNLARTPFADSLIDPVRQALISADKALSKGRAFNPTRDHASFTIMTSDYEAVVLLMPMIEHFSHSAPNIEIAVRPMNADFGTQLRRGDVDLVIAPREVIHNIKPFAMQVLYRDRYVMVIDGNHNNISGPIDNRTMEKLAFVNYNGGQENRLDTHFRTHLNFLGLSIKENFTTPGFVESLMMVHGTNLANISLERLANRLARRADLDVLECPLSNEYITEMMYWNPLISGDAAHTWLRESVLHIAENL